MCWTMGISIGLASVAFGLAAYEYSWTRNRWYASAIAYWGLMEFLQAIQHLYAAKPEDDYAMCADPTNQFLTDLGMLHTAFQPLSMCLLLLSFHRRFDPIVRAQSDLIWWMCVLTGVWFLSSDLLDAIWRDEPFVMSKATADCPNYAWSIEGYDGNSGLTTPNLPGLSCTYYAPTPTRHLAWAVSMYPSTYNAPTACMHCFAMFVPYFAMANRPFFQTIALMGWLSGPFLVNHITKSVNEQPVIWCFYSVIQVCTFAMIVRSFKLYEIQPHDTLVFEPLRGQPGEEKLTYVRVYDNSTDHTQSLKQQEEDEEDSTEEHDENHEDSLQEQVEGEGLL